MSSEDRQVPLWEPSAEERERAEMTRFMRFAGERHGRVFADYDELWQWSVAEVEQFWASIWEFCGVRASKPYERVLGSHEMPGTRWFEGAELNYAENILASRPDRYHPPRFETLGRGAIPRSRRSCTARSCASCTS